MTCCDGSRKRFRPPPAAATPSGTRPVLPARGNPLCSRCARPSPLDCSSLPKLSASAAATRADSHRFNHLIFFSVALNFLWSLFSRVITLSLARSLYATVIVSFFHFFKAGIGRKLPRRRPEPILRFCCYLRLLHIFHGFLVTGFFSGWDSRKRFSSASSPLFLLYLQFDHRGVW